MADYWSWLLTAVGLTCFWLAGRKVWWAWYVGIAGQALWLAYSRVGRYANQKTPLTRPE